MSVLEIPSGLLAEIQRHAAAVYPEECCGVLLGRAAPAQEGAPTGDSADSRDQQHCRIEELLAAENIREDEHRHNRYLIPPEVILRAQREGRERGIDIVGYYHSHPDHPAVPSEFDREHAWPATSYLIVSVRGGEVADTRSWRLADSRERFDEESLQELDERLRTGL